MRRSRPYPVGIHSAAIFSISFALTVVSSAFAQAVFVNHFEDAGTHGWTVTNPPTCSDGWQNGSETGLDCGGPDCPSCALSCAPPAAGAPGGACSDDADCGTGNFCLAGNEGTGAFGPVLYAPEGYCVVGDFSLLPGTCATDADCDPGTICVEYLDYPGLPGYQSCLPACACTGAACPAHQACEDTFVAIQLDDAVCVPGKGDAFDGSACAGIYECSEHSACISDAEYPGGECQRYDCTPGDDSSCNGGHCIATDPGIGEPFSCVDTCAFDIDCRSAEGYRCVDPDGGGGEPAYCRHPHVGDPCDGDAACGGGSWSCLTGVSFPGGYCTLTGCPVGGSNTGCANGALCFDAPGPGSNYCVDRCEGAGQGSCRAGYSCIDVDPGAATLLGCVQN